MQALSRREENEVMDQAKLEAEAACKDAIREFAECATGRTFSMGWACKGYLQSMRTCMREAVPESRIDQIKADYIQHREERKVQSLENYKKERIESMKRHAGLKDEVINASAPSPSPAFVPSPPGSAPSGLQETGNGTWVGTGFGREPVWIEEGTTPGFGR